jgi:hypothetical protein
LVNIFLHFCNSWLNRWQSKGYRPCNMRTLGVNGQSESAGVVNKNLRTP